MERKHLTFEAVDREAVARVAAHVQLLDLRLVMHHAALNCDHDDVPLDWPARARIGVDCHVEGTEGPGTLFTVGAYFYVAFWRDEAQKPESEQAEGELPADVDLSLIYELDYELRDKEGITDEDLEHFAFLNSRFNAWPYFRQSVQASTMQMGIPPMIIPVQTVRPIAVRRSD